MSDLIDRQTAIEAIAKMMPQSFTPDGSHPADKEIFIAQEAFADCIKTIEILPPAQPERIRGHWIESKGLNTLMKKFIEKGETWRVCDKCGAGFMIGYQYECDKLYHETFHNFCPKCGAEMEVTK